MAFVGMDIGGTHDLGSRVRAAADAVEQTRQSLLNALTMADLDSAAPALLATAQQNLTTLTTQVLDKADVAERPIEPPVTPLEFTLIDAVPGASLSERPSGLGLPFSPHAGKEYHIAVLGDSFISGLGLLGNDSYVGTGPTVDDIVQPNPAYQSRDAGALQAVRQLQLQYPDAEIRITYTADRLNPEIVPPVLPTLNGGPVINVTFAAEAGADTDELLGHDYLNWAYGPHNSQINAVTYKTDTVLLSIGGNNGGNDKYGGFELVLRSALQPGQSPYLLLDLPGLRDGALATGTAQINELVGRLSTDLRGVEEVITAISAKGGDTMNILYAGYPYALSPLDDRNIPLALPGDGRQWPMNQFDPESMGIPLNLIDILESQASARYWTTMTMWQEHYAGRVPLQPGQDLQFLLPNWNDNTLVSSNPAVNGLVGDEDVRSFHPNELGQPLYRDLLHPPLVDSAARVLGQGQTELLSPFDSFGSAAGQLQAAAYDPGQVDWSAVSPIGSGEPTCPASACPTSRSTRASGCRTARGTPRRWRISP
ncbi:hypothetical protein [Micromonospora sp. LOL_023]|uniref:hypothetical protein n=1 Tax=Micromonospora sp. LOL_023 TaxID=3345418 RepID=UPI003A8A2539